MLTRNEDHEKRLKKSLEGCKMLCFSKKESQKAVFVHINARFILDRREFLDVSPQM